MKQLFEIRNVFNLIAFHMVLWRLTDATVCHVVIIKPSEIEHSGGKYILRVCVRLLSSRTLGTKGLELRIDALLMQKC